MTPSRPSAASTASAYNSWKSGIRLQKSGRACGQIQNHSTTSARRPKLPDSPARTRFAPSPTGSLHLGSIRTALFNYLLAKRTNGQFLLRIEDTDQKRTLLGAENQLYEDLRWAGLNWDEGPTVGGPCGPYRQSERTAIYITHIKFLLEREKAYRCFCSAERIDELNRSRHVRGLPLGYDRRCADISSGEAEERAHQGHSHVIRFRAPKEYPKYVDLVYGKTGHGSQKGRSLHIDQPVYDDPILIKSDGYPTYHFANVVDDKLMKITHVIRGSEWISSTPLHVALYEAMNWSPPAFGHVPLLVDQNRQKLSKRNFNSDISSFRRQGIFPVALTNFTALLGWSHNQRSDVMDLEELRSVFDLKFTKGNTIVSLDKLRFLQEHHARRRVRGGGEEFEQMIRDVALALLNRYGASEVARFIGNRRLSHVVASMLRADSLPYRSAQNFTELCDIFISQPKWPTYKPSHTSALQSYRICAASLCLVPENDWKADIHRGNLASIQPDSSSGTGQQSLNLVKEWRREFYHYLRWALLAGLPGPSIPESMEILGREICLERIRSADLQTRSVEAMREKPQLEVAAAVA